MTKNKKDIYHLKVTAEVEVRADSFEEAVKNYFDDGVVASELTTIEYIYSETVK